MIAKKDYIRAMVKNNVFSIVGAVIYYAGGFLFIEPLYRLISHDLFMIIIALYVALLPFLLFANKRTIKFYENNRRIMRNYKWQQSQILQVGKEEFQKREKEQDKKNLIELINRMAEAKTKRKQS